MLYYFSHWRIVSFAIFSIKETVMIMKDFFFGAFTGVAFYILIYLLTKAFL